MPCARSERTMFRTRKTMPIYGMSQQEPNHTSCSKPRSIDEELLHAEGRPGAGRCQLPPDPVLGQVELHQSLLPASREVSAVHVRGCPPDQDRRDAAQAWVFGAAAARDDRHPPVDPEEDQ